VINHLSPSEDAISAVNPALAATVQSLEDQKMYRGESLQIFSDPLIISFR
jgi:hypothetical protein